MINIEEMEINNGFVTVVDDYGLLTIRLEKKYVEEIMNFFNTYVQGKLHMSAEFNINGGILKLNLINFDDEFDINGRMYGKMNNSYFQDFEFEECDIETWDKIYMFLKEN